MEKMTENCILMFRVTEPWADLHSLYQHFLLPERHPPEKLFPWLILHLLLTSMPLFNIRNMSSNTR